MRVKGVSARYRWCPVHGQPLMLWHRSGKAICPLQGCPYHEPHECEMTAPVSCGCDVIETTIEVPDEMLDAEGNEALEIMRRRVFLTAPNCYVGEKKK